MYDPDNILTGNLHLDFIKDKCAVYINEIPKDTLPYFREIVRSGKSKEPMATYDSIHYHDEKWEVGDFCEILSGRHKGGYLHKLASSLYILISDPAFILQTFGMEPGEYTANSASIPYKGLRLHSDPVPAGVAGLSIHQVLDTVLMACAEGNTQYLIGLALKHIPLILTVVPFGAKFKAEFKGVLVPLSLTGGIAAVGDTKLGVTIKLIYALNAQGHYPILFTEHAEYYRFCLHTTAKTCHKNVLNVALMSAPKI